MTNRSTATGVVVLCVTMTSLACGSSDDEGGPITASWKFESGDCASNGVEKVRVSVTHTGSPATTKEFACSAGKGEIGEISSGAYGFLAEGLDASGKVLFTSTQSATFQGSVPSGGTAIDMTLRPAPSKVIVTWKGCPSGFVLPYLITLYKGTSTTDKVTSVQESCQASTATLEDVAPGSYTVDLDSRAVSPKVKATAPVTVKAGETATVAIAAP